jgi:hypothetical protein
VRRAVGALASDLIRLILNHGLRLVAIGLVLGIAGALSMAHLLEQLLYGIQSVVYIDLRRRHDSPGPGVDRCDAVSGNQGCDSRSARRAAARVASPARG